jgi:hypothetical protein
VREVAATSKDLAGTMTEVRGAIVSGAGVTLGTCGALAEQIWAPPNGDPNATQKLRFRATLGRPLDNDGYALLAYNESAVSPDPFFQLFVQVIDPGGCPMGAPVQISDEPADVSVTQIQVVPTARRLHEMSITAATANMTDCGRTTPGAGAKVSFLMITLRGRRLKILKSAGFGSGFVAVGDPLAGRS